MTEIDQDLAARLREARSVSGLSQAALAARIGVTSAQVSRIEAGLRRPSISVLKAWLDACGFDMSVVELGSDARTVELLDAVDSMTEADYILGLRILRLLPKLSPEARRALVGLVSALEA